MDPMIINTISLYLFAIVSVGIGLLCFSAAYDVYLVKARKPGHQ